LVRVYQTWSFQKVNKKKIFFSFNFFKKKFWVKSFKKNFCEKNFSLKGNGKSAYFFFFLSLKDNFEMSFMPEREKSFEMLKNMILTRVLSPKKREKHFLRFHADYLYFMMIATFVYLIWWKENHFFMIFITVPPKAGNSI
jgi:hypothetical protein